MSSEPTIEIRRTTVDDAGIIADIGARTFRESHGHSASKEDIDHYITEAFDLATLSVELKEKGSIYHLISCDQEDIGYSKIILDTGTEGLTIARPTNMERSYVLEEFHGLQLGRRLMESNIDFAKQHGQEGIWLCTWTGNHRAIRFYKKMGFEIEGQYDFRISDTHVDPDHVMVMRW